MRLGLSVKEKVSQILTVLKAGKIYLLLDQE